MLEFSRMSLRLDIFFSLDHLEFSENRWKKACFKHLMSLSRYFLRQYGPHLALRDMIIKCRVMGPYTMSIFHFKKEWKIKLHWCPNLFRNSLFPSTWEQFSDGRCHPEVQAGWLLAISSWVSLSCGWWRGRFVGKIYRGPLLLNANSCHHNTTPGKYQPVSI